jgi:hypothetical protein
MLVVEGMDILWLAGLSPSLPAAVGGPSGNECDGRRKAAATDADGDLPPPLIRWTADGYWWMLWAGRG